MREYSEEIVEAIKENVDIVEFIGDYVELHKKGREYFGKCPFHDERTGSFSVTPRNQTYFCFGCQKGGDIITFCQDFLDMSYDKTIEYLGGVAGITPEKTRISPAVRFIRKTAKKKKNKQVAEKHKILDPRIMRNFQKREITKWVQEGIPQKVMDFYEVRYDQQSKRIVYPVYDHAGNLINIKGRTIYDNYKDLDIPKYINYEPVGDLDYFQGFYAKKSALLDSKEIIIFESLKSVMKADSYGYMNSVSAETSHITIFQARILIKMHCDVVLAFDSDVPLFKIKNNDVIKQLCQFTNVFVVTDTKGLLGKREEKNSPVDKGKDVWDELYETRIKL